MLGIKNVILALIPLLISSFSWAQIIVTNPDFEITDPTAITQVKNWTTEGALIQCNIDSKTVWQGKYAMHVSKPTAEGTGRFYQEFQYKSNNLKKYSITAAIKTRNVKEGYAGISVRVLDKAGNIVCHQNLNMQARKINGTKDWTVYNGDFYTNEFADKIKIAGFIWRSGEMWIDAIRIEAKPFSSAPLSKNIQQYITEYFSIIRAKSIVQNAQFINQLEANTILLCRGNTDISYCHFVLKNITFNLGDGHSFFSTPEEWAALQDGNKRIQEGNASFATGKMMDNNIAHINIPTFNATDIVMVKKAADSLQRLIELLDAQQPRGWIVDLIQNGGGNSFAMFPGLGPLMGNGICGYSISADGGRKALIYKDGLAGWDNKLDTYVSNPYAVKNNTLPIAVLYSNRTGSSGEVTALTLRGLANSRSFGQSTYGVTTRVVNYLLRDKASLNLASGYDADRKMNLFKGTKIPPDVATTDYESALQAAIQWINEY